MARTPAAFKQADIVRAVKAVQAAKIAVSSVEIAPDGTIRVLSAITGTSTEPSSPFDSWKEKRHASAP